MENSLTLIVNGASIPLRRESSMNSIRLQMNGISLDNSEDEYPLSLFMLLKMRAIYTPRALLKDTTSGVGKKQKGGSNRSMKKKLFYSHFESVQRKFYCRK